MPRNASRRVSQRSSSPRDALCRACRTFVLEGLEPRSLLTTIVPSGPEFQVNTYTTQDQVTPAIAMAGDGAFVVAWSSNGQDGNLEGVYGQRYDAAGLPQGGEFLVNTTTTGSQKAPAIAMDADGDFVIAWQGYSQASRNIDIYAQRFDAAGQPLDDEFRVNTSVLSHQTNPAVAMDADGDFVIVWQTDGLNGSTAGIYAQRFDAAGEMQGSEFLVNDLVAGFVQYSPTVAMEPQGSFVVAWSEAYRTIQARRFTATGEPLGNQIAVVASGDWIRSMPSLTLHADGRFIVAWQSFNQDSSFDGIYARRYDTSSAPLGDEFRVNTTIAYAQRYPNVAMDSVGNFIVTWQSEKQDGNYDGIYAQRYNANGQPEGMEFRVNTFTTNYQSRSRVAMRTGNPLVVVWQSYTQDGDRYGIFAQRFAPLTNPATVQGIAWTDVNGNGLRDESEPGLSGVSVKLFSSSTALLAVTTTTDGGQYRFDDVPPGTGYYIEFVASPKQRFTLSKVGNDDQWDSDPNPTTGRTDPFDLVPDQITTGQDAGLFVPPTVSGVTYHDRNADGQRDPAEAAMPGLFIFADLDGDGQLDADEPSTRTNATGAYTLTISRPGTYHLAQVVLDHWYLSTPASSLLLNVSSGENRIGLDIGSFTLEPSVNAGPAGPATQHTTTSWPYYVNEAKVAMAPNGNYVVIWRDRQTHGRLFAQLFTATGQPRGAAFPVNAVFETGWPIDAAVAMDSTGGFTIVWNNNDWVPSLRNLYARQYDAQGTPLGDQFLVNDETAPGEQHIPDIAVAPDGAFVVTWRADMSIRARRFDRSGTPLAPEFIVATGTTYPDIMPSGPRIAMDSHGGFLITWFMVESSGDSAGIYARRYSAEGTSLGNEFLITAIPGHLPDVAMAPDGDFVVVWSDQEDTALDYGLRAQRYNAANVPQGAAFRVSDSKGDLPSVTMDAHGGFVVTWHTTVSPSGPFLAKARRYNAAGLPEGDEFRVADSAMGGPPSVAADAAGNFVVAWLRNPEVFSQRYQIASANFTGLAGSDTYTLSRSADQTIIAVQSGAVSSTFTYPSHLAINIGAEAGDDRLILDFSTGNPIPPSGLTFTGGDGNDSFLFTTSTTYASFTTPLDLTDNTLLISNATLPQVESWLRANLLFSSLKTQYTTLAPFPQPDGSILIKLTYYGDTNNDGTVNLSDYFTIDSGYLNQRQGFTHGDANLDGQINLDDYFLIDSAYLNQSGSLAATMANSILVSASADQPTRIPRAKDKTGGRRKVFSTQRVKLGRRDKLHARQSKLSR